MSLFSMFAEEEIEGKYAWKWPQSARDDVMTIHGLPSGVDDGDYNELAHFMDQKRKECSDIADLESGMPLRNGIYRQVVDPHEIRLLYLYPTQEDEDDDRSDSNFSRPLTCSLEHASVQFEYKESNPGKQSRHAVDLKTGKPIWYTALSYCWGPPDNTCSIRVLLDGATGKRAEAGSAASVNMPITPNLDAALRYLREEGDGKTIILWIDQLCINQADDEEKGRQIGLMAMIYRRAMNTAIWLGEYTDVQMMPVAKTSAASESIGVSASNSESEAAQSITGVGILRFIYHEFRFMFGQECSAELFARIELPCSKELVWSKLRSVLDRPYFWRVWIIQEAVLSETPIVRIGKEKMHWTVFSMFCLVAEKSGFLNWLQTEVGATAGVDLLPICEIISKIDNFSLDLPRMTVGISTMTLLRETRYALATVRKDKVFGILGLSHSKMRVDYRMTDEMVCHSIALELLQQEIDDIAARKDLFPTWKFWRFTLVLCAVDHETSGAVPTWVPDWTRQRETATIGGTTMVFAFFHAGGKDREDRSFEMQEDSKAVYITGRIVDSVRELSDPCKDAGDLTRARDEPNTIIQAFLDFARLHGKVAQDPKDSAASRSSLWTTLVAGKDAPGTGKSPIQYHVVFENSLAPTPTKSQHLPQEGRPSKSKGKKCKENATRKQPAHERLLPDVLVAYTNAVHNRRLCVTGEGRLALVPRYARKEDKVAIFAGFPVPYILRPAAPGQFQLVGECYVNGIMEGEAAGPEVKVETLQIV